MIGFSDAVANTILDDFIGAYTPATVHLALLTAEPTSTDTGSTMAEASYSGYARLALTATDFDPAADRTKLNSGVLSFAQALSAETGITHGALMSAATTGDILMVGVLASPMDVAVGDVPTLDVGALALTFP